MPRPEAEAEEAEVKYLEELSLIIFALYAVTWLFGSFRSTSKDGRR